MLYERWEEDHASNEIVADSSGSAYVGGDSRTQTVSSAQNDGPNALAILGFLLAVAILSVCALSIALNVDSESVDPKVQAVEDSAGELANELRGFALTLSNDARAFNMETEGSCRCVV